eukprot:gnl/Trimastix_PCT/2007.p1 GENE.gnl/Trimastix_PCT/2007~~gnl/Trimastix_PCT/2007.p1  ORF type:complete len:346 (+),score=75.07 gnl/Trimastix_PCT/2007:62-1099(+)
MSNPPSPPLESLHNHTTSSDGEFTHFQLLDLAAEKGISVIAFTDHDSLPSPTIYQKLQNEYRNHPVKWIAGIEISSGLPTELGGGSYSGLHIVGLFVDPNNPNLKLHCERAQRARVTRMQKMVANLNEIGFHITEQDCLVASGGEAVGRPHIVKALFSRMEENAPVFERIRNEMKQAAEGNPELSAKYEDMMKQEEGRHPYALFLTPSAFMPHIYVDYEYTLDMDSSVRLIREAGGVALIAHYFTCEPKISHEFLDSLLESRRIDGLEIVFGVKELEQTERHRAFVRELVAKHDCLVSGGGDIHTLADMENYVSEAVRPVVSTTAGMAAELLRRSAATREHSSIE